MSRFQYQYDGTEDGSVKERAHQQAGPSRRPIETQDEDYDIEAALEFEQADQYNDWEPHDHLYDEPGLSRAGPSRAVDLSKQSTSHGQSRRTKTNGKGKGRDVLDIASDEHDDQEHADMIPVPIDSRGSVVSDARIETVSE